MHLLIVEDDTLLAKAIGDPLRSLAPRLHFARTGADTLEALYALYALYAKRFDLACWISACRDYRGWKCSTPAAEGCAHLGVDSNRATDLKTGYAGWTLVLMIT
ncbi:MAG: hypothetical protein P3W87_000320 [Gammaproteobacteria bacterium]|nr:hypothetical protein [Gammaproteobacteria bacterium]